METIQQTSILPTKKAKLIPSETKKTVVKAAKPVLKQSKEVNNEMKQQYGAIEVVTSAKLKRRLVHDPYYAKLFLSDESYLMLNIVGMQLGVTWDEALRGLIEMHNSSADKLSGLKNFIPALN